MSNTISYQRRMSVDVHPSQQYAVARPPCQPITNDAPAERTKGAFSFANLMSKSSRSGSPAPAAAKPKKAKKEQLDVAAIYGTEFARAVHADQFLNGGRLEDSIARVQRNNDKMARRRAEKLGVPYVPDASAPVRGLNGELFGDATEEQERRGLVRNAYKGMPEPTAYKSKSKGMPSDDDTNSEDEGEAPAWAQYRPAPQQQQHQRAHHDARADFFASSFAPQQAPTYRARA